MKPHYFVGAAPITPGASPLPRSAIAVLATVAGTITGVSEDGTTVTAIPIQAGVPLPLSFSRITAATATGLFALW